MRTTIAIDDHLLAEARERARRQGLTLGAYVEEALRLAIHAPAPTKRAVRKLPVFRGGTGPHPGVDLTSSRAIAEILDEDVPLDKLR